MTTEASTLAVGRFIRPWLVGAVVCALGLAACGGDDGEEGPSTEPVAEASSTTVAEEEPDVVGETSTLDEADEPASDDEGGLEGRILTIVQPIEPPDLHVDDPSNGLQVASWVREGMLESLFGVSAALSYYPELLAAEPAVTENDDGQVTIDYRLRDGLLWSDGEPLTTADVAYTFDILTEGCPLDSDGSIADGRLDGCRYLLGDRSGLDQVMAVDVGNDTEFTVTLAAFVADWRSLFGPIFAAHAYGDDAETVNQRLRLMRGPGGPLPVSGPLQLTAWQPGRQMELSVNDRYHGSTSPDLDGQEITVDGVRLRFSFAADEQLALLQSGEAQLVVTPLRLGYELGDDDGVTAEVITGPTYLHWGFNLLNPHLARPSARQAIAALIDREAMVAEVFDGFGGSFDPAGTGNAYWAPTQPAYVDDQPPSPDVAAGLLTADGYVLGDDGVYAHPTDGRLSVRVGTSGGDPFRERVQAILQAQLGAGGVEVVIDNIGSGRFLPDGPFAPEAIAAANSGGSDGDPAIWDIAQFSLRGGPSPGAVSGSFFTDSPVNPYGFSNPAFDARAAECDSIVDDDDRAACYRELSRIVTTVDADGVGLVVVPLAHGSSVALSRGLEAIAPMTDADDGGPLVNLAAYRLAGE